ncbi:hypothetical protein [Pseudaminobacter sp. NGMCC 1.201702]|uniref:hypothetical protein n=1 Tax=Pseudaminobacter sp. NGMCC 1.201702 TaxID=3391825 RepID=UPI0039EE17F1
MPNMKLLLCASAVCLFSLSSISAAKPPDRGNTPGLGWGKGGSISLSVNAGGVGASTSIGRSNGGSKNLAVPGPVVGAGLPILVVAGGYVWLRRRIRRRKEQNGAV